MRRWAPIALSLLALLATAGCGTGADSNPAPALPAGVAASTGAPSGPTTGYDTADAMYRQMFQGLNLPTGVTFPAHLPNAGDQYQANAGLVTAQNFWLCAWLWDFIDNSGAKTKAQAAATELAKYDLMDAYTKALDARGRASVDAAIKAAKADSKAAVQSFAQTTCAGPFFGQARPSTQ
jgi:hypothetical protein